MKPHPVLLIPGIMGCELWFENLKIWPSAKVLLNPAYLIPWVPLTAGAPLDTYQPLLDFIRKQGYGQDDLFVFGYDWRAGIETAAKALGTFVDNEVRRRNGGQIIVIAHSLGCLVARFALNRRLLEPAKVKLVIAAGPPMLGSAVAFKAVIEMPQIASRVSRLYRVLKRVCRGWVVGDETALCKTLMTVRSLLELMPPQSQKFLRWHGTDHSCFEWPGWPDALKTLYAEVEQTQKALLPWVDPHLPRHLILSREHVTEAGYVIDDQPPYGIQVSARQFPGDGRVTVESGEEFGSGSSSLFVNSQHDQLLNDRGTWSDLARVL